LAVEVTVQLLWLGVPGFIEALLGMGYPMDCLAAGELVVAAVARGQALVAQRLLLSGARVLGSDVTDRALGDIPLTVEVIHGLTGLIGHDWRGVGVKAKVCKRVFASPNWWATGVFPVLLSVRPPDLEVGEWIWDLRHRVDCRVQIAAVVRAGIDGMASPLFVRREHFLDRGRMEWAAQLAERGLLVYVTVGNVSDFLREYIGARCDVVLLRWAFAHGLSFPVGYRGAPLKHCMKRNVRLPPRTRAEVAALLIENGASGLHKQEDLDRFHIFALENSVVLSHLADRVHLVSPTQPKLEKPYRGRGGWRLPRWTWWVGRGVRSTGESASIAFDTARRPTVIRRRDCCVFIRRDWTGLVR
jgi:hypothetical protein